ncbi:cytochrome c [Acetobacter sp. AN02]|uniref:cytochrome c n=1 Tax=Acetobacter sp. AN02 TaxID=2894186 RepID=UPI0024345206|nr:cytochrome c [Acetobacter sp. AN02]MDG6095012.1 cytochrome c [Acetobacter sp. AN02]
MAVRMIRTLLLCGMASLPGMVRAAAPSPSGTHEISGPGQEDLQKLIARGAYVARMADCAACYTGADGTPYAGGYRIVSPLGAIIAKNISPSSEFGIGGWSEAEFARAVRKGVTPHGHLYPAMPYPAYGGMSDDDIHALYTYLTKAVRPVERPALPVTKLPFPFSFRHLMIGWNALFARSRPARSGDMAPGSIERGRYLVEVTGHCSGCHTPRNALMAEDRSRHLAGAPVGGWFAPNITSDTVSGIGGWSEDELVTYLKTGSVAGKSQAAGGMAEAISHGLRHLEESDLRAIARYLRTVPPVRESGQSVPAYGVLSARPDDMDAYAFGRDRSAAAMADGSGTGGARIYLSACASCHQLHGEGTGDQFFPSLFRNSSTGGPSARNLVMAILKGVHRETDDGDVVMPAFSDELNDAQIAAVSEYVLHRFGNSSLRVSAEDVAALRAERQRSVLSEFSGVLGAAVACGVAALAGLYLLGAGRRARAVMTISEEED